MHEIRLRASFPLFAAAVLLCGAVVTATASHAQEQRRYAVTITNLTHGQAFGPPLVFTHRPSFSLFQLGEPASQGVAEMAEDAVLDTLVADLEASPDVLDVAVADGPLPPGGSVTLKVWSDPPFRRLSAAQMLVTTNDAFFALQDARLPRAVGRAFDYYAIAYDAGSEANSEECAAIPGPPCGNAGVRDTDGAEGFVYVHPGIYGVGDLDPTARDWRNPVAKITVVRIDE